MPGHESIFEAIMATKTRHGRNLGSKKQRSFPMRIFSLRLFGFAFSLLLLAGLIKTQIIQGVYYRDLSEGNRVREVLLPAPRGIIYDRNGVALVSNVPAYRLIKCEQEGRVCKGSTISRDQAIDLQVSGKATDTELAIDSARQYLNKEITAHVLGYVSEVAPSELVADKSYIPGDKKGRGGIEESYEDMLRGVRGKELVEVDAMGKKLKTLGSVPPVSGKNLKLTLDLAVQKAAYQAISEKPNQGSAVVVARPKTGEILALTSYPSFDPNIFTDFSVDANERDRGLNEVFTNSLRPLFDRAISGTYPPGSTFKIITSTAGLESGKIKEDSTVEDTGVIVIGPYSFANWKYLHDGGTQGVLNVVGALKVSNDIFFYRLGEKLGLDTLVSWMAKFGLASKTGIDLPGEEAGIIPTAKWRAINAPEWYLGDTFHLAIGQGKMLVTPLQMNAWTNVVANGGKLCRPHLFGPDECKDLGISKKTLGLVKEGLIEACSEGGTAYPLFNFQDPKDKSKTIQVACKTGTAEFGDPKDNTHAWLTAYAPANNPEISVTVLVEAGGEGSDTAAPIVKQILQKYFAK